MNLIEQVTESINSLDSWISKNGWSGFDPYDIQCEFLLHKFTSKSKKAKYIHSFLFSKFNQYIPRLSRRILGVHPQINPKGMGLFTSAYSQLYKLTNQKSFLNKATFCAEWLLKNNNKNYADLCWGYPFDWQSNIFLPNGTPSGVVTSHIGHGFWDLYQITKNEKYLLACESISKFFLNSLNQTKNKNGICFSYTPLDNFQVHNANLFVSEFIIRLGTMLKHKKWIDIGLDAANFSLQEQQLNGSLCYWSINDAIKYNIPCKNDHYHSGFEIRMLYKIWQLTKQKRFKEAVDKYYNFYCKNYFSQNYAPILSPKGKFIIEIHACSEALLVNSLLSRDYTIANKILENTIKWIIPNMQKTNGWFIYKFIKKGGKITTINIPYIRWGQAWMLLGLSKTLESIIERKQ